MGSIQFILFPFMHLLKKKKNDQLNKSDSLIPSMHFGRKIECVHHCTVSAPECQLTFHEILCHTFCLSPMFLFPGQQPKKNTSFILS